MSWIEGEQRIAKRVLPEKEWERQYALEGFLEEDIAKQELFKFFRNNLTIAAKVLIGLELYPIQSILLKIMFDREYVLAIQGRGSSKSWIAATFAALYALMVPNSKIGILSCSYRQAKHIFKYIETFSQKKSGKLFKDCIDHISRRPEENTMTIGSSTITAVPLGDGSTLRGFRFTVILVDELLLMPEKILNEVILPFISVVPNPMERDKLKDAEAFLIENGLMKEEERYIWPNNKLIGLSSASYAFEYLYKLYQIYESLITNKSSELLTEEMKGMLGGASRAIFHTSYEAMPEGMYEKSAIQQFKATMSESQFARELCSRFTDDSSGYFKISKMMACTVKDGERPCVEVKGDKDSEYVLSFDPSWAENDTADDFAIHVLKLNKENRTSTLVHSYAVHGANLKQHIEYFIYLIENFNVVLMAGDYASGAQFINSCNESQLFKDKNLNLKLIEEEFDDQDYVSCLRNGRNQYNLQDKRIVCLRKFTNDWIRKGNELLQANFDHKRIWFGARCMDATYHEQLSKEIPIDVINFDSPEDVGTETGKGKQIEFIERQHQLINLTKAECALIQVKSNPQGSQTFDLPENLKRQTGSNKTRRDSYTALVIGNWFVKIYFDMMDTKVENNATFEPMMI